MQNNQVEIVTLPEKHFVGVPVTNAFARINPASLQEANQQFLDRRVR